MRISCFVAGAILIASAAFSQTTKDPFPAPIPAKDGAILAKFADFAAIPYAADEAPRMMLLVDEPGTHRLFVNTMRGAIYSMSYDGKTVTPYLDIDDPTWGVNVQFSSHDRGFQSFAFHPQFDQRGTPGYGKFYTYTDTANITKKADFLPNGPGHIHDTVLLEWTAKNPEGRRLTMAGRRAKFSGPRSRFRFTMAGSLRSIRWRNRGAPITACCMWAWRTAATEATRTNMRRTFPLRLARFFASTRWVRTALTGNTEFLRRIRS
jgi:hypothetical protein